MALIFTLAGLWRGRYCWPQSRGMRNPVRLLKALIWVYLSVGVLLILIIGFACFISQGISPDTLDLLEKILLCWGLVLLPFLKVAQIYVKKHQREKSQV